MVGQPSVEYDFITFVISLLKHCSRKILQRQHFPPLNLIVFVENLHVVVLQSQIGIPQPRERERIKRERARERKSESESESESERERFDIRDKKVCLRTIHILFVCT